MSKLDEIRARLSRLQWRENSSEAALDYYIEDIAALLQITDAALAYRAATQAPDGVQAAEQRLFEVLERLEQA